MNKFFTKMFCMALFFALCVLGLNAQERQLTDAKAKVQRVEIGQTPSLQVPRAEIHQNAIETGNAPAVQVQRANDRVVAPTVGIPSVEMRDAADYVPLAVGESVERAECRIAVKAPKRERSSNAPTERVATPNSDGRGPTSPAYGVDSRYGIHSPCSAPLNNPSGISYLGGYTIPTQLSTGDWVNGGWYAVTENSNAIYKIDPATGAYTVVAYHSVPSALGMGYNPVDGQVYVSSVDYDGYNYINDFYTVDIATGATQYINSVMDYHYGIFMAFTFTNNGECIAVHSDGYLMKVNVAAGSYTVWMDVWNDYGVYPYYYYQDIATDRDDNTIYWSAENDNAYQYPGNELWKINVNAGTMEYMGMFDSSSTGTQIVAFAIPSDSTPPPPGDCDVKIVVYGAYSDSWGSSSQQSIIEVYHDGSLFYTYIPYTTMVYDGAGYTTCCCGQGTHSAGLQYRAEIDLQIPSGTVEFYITTNTGNYPNGEGAIEIWNNGENIYCIANPMGVPAATKTLFHTEQLDCGGPPPGDCDVKIIAYGAYSDSWGSSSQQSIIEVYHEGSLFYTYIPYTTMVYGTYTTCCCGQGTHSAGLQYRAEIDLQIPSGTVEFYITTNTGNYPNGEGAIEIWNNGENIYCIANPMGVPAATKTLFHTEQLNCGGTPPIPGDCPYIFTYTGSVQNVTLPAGEYTIECWGADGGGVNGGTGGYSKGTYTVTAPTTLYMYVGGKGAVGNPATGGWNGGGNSGTYSGYTQGSGGGGTDVRTSQNTSYADRIIVAGGAGGAGSNHGSGGVDGGGNGGGTNGQDGDYGSMGTEHGKGGTQTAGGAGGVWYSDVAQSGALGIGGYGVQTGGGGGGGWYGGGGSAWEGSGGGSGYIGGVTGGVTAQPTEGAFAMNPDNSGNGYIRITCDGTPPIPADCPYIFTYGGGMQDVTLPPGEYTIECWGADGGGDYDDNYNEYAIGKGGYSKGTYTVTTPTTLYVAVGGKGTLGTPAAGGWNGGGMSGGSYASNGSGGGATHVATATGTLSSLSGNQSAVVIVAGGAGGTGSNYGSGNDMRMIGGDGGGTTGETGNAYGGSGEPGAPGKGGTQTAGGAGGQYPGYSFSPSGTFGAGGNGMSGQTDGGGGGGWYGGGAGSWEGGGGGAGYIGGVTGGVTAQPTESAFAMNPDNSGNGYVRITCDAFGDCDPITDLQYSYVNGCDLKLTWTPPAGKGKVMNGPMMLTDTELAAKKVVLPEGYTPGKGTSLTAWLSQQAPQGDMPTKSGDSKACNITLPHFEGFETTPSLTMPDCWTAPLSHYFGFGGYLPNVYYYFPNSGNNSLWLAATTADNGGICYAVTPSIPVNIHNVKVSFALTREGESDAGTFTVGVMSDPNDPATFEAVQVINITVPDYDYTTFEVNFAGTTLTGSDRHIAFKQQVYNAGGFSYWIDDVTITGDAGDHTYNIYEGSNLIGTTDSPTYTIPNAGAPGEYCVTVDCDGGKGGAGKATGSLTTPNANNGGGGVAFDVVAGAEDLTITGFDFSFEYTGTTTVYVYYRPGTSCGYAGSSAGWTAVGQQNVTITASGYSNYTYVQMPGTLTIPAGETYGLYVATLGSATYINYRDSNPGYACGVSNVASDSYVTIKEGVGLVIPSTLFEPGAIMSNRNFAGTMHYTTDGNNPGGGESAPVCVTVPGCGDCNPPQNLQYSYENGCDLVLTWDPPAGKGAGKVMNGPVMTTQEMETKRAEMMAKFANGEKSTSGNIAIDRSKLVRPEGQPMKEFVIPGDGKGPNTVAYGVDNSYWDFLKFPLNNVGNYQVFGYESYDYVTGADYVDGYWYVILEYPTYGYPYILKIDPNTGNYTYVSHSCYHYMITGMAYNDTEGMAYIVASEGYIGDPNYFYKVNLNTGQTTSAFTVTQGGYVIYDIVWTNNGKLIGVAVDFNAYQTHIVEINPSNGALTILMTAPIYSYYEQSMAYDRDDGMIYWMADTFWQVGSPALYKIDLSNNTITKVMDVTFFSTGIAGFAIPGESNIIPGDYTYNVYNDGTLVGTTTDLTYTIPNAGAPGEYCVTVDCDGGKGAGKTVMTPGNAPTLMPEKAAMPEREQRAAIGPRKPLSERTSKEGQPTQGFTIPSQNGKGPNTVAYGVEDYYWDLVNFPLNNVSNYSYGGGYLFDYVTGGDYVDGYWYVITEYTDYIPCIFKIDPANGSYTYVQHNIPDYVTFGMTYNDAEDIAYVVGCSADYYAPNYFYKVNLNTGQYTYAFTVSQGGYTIYDIAFTNAGKLIGVAVDWDYSQTHLVEINTTTGALTILVTAPFYSPYEQSLACDREDGMLYWTTDNFAYYSGRALYSFNPSNNQLSKVGDIPSDFYYGIQGLAIPATGTPPIPDGESAPICVTVPGCGDCAPITNLQASCDGNDVILTWDPPIGKGKTMTGPTMPEEVTTPKEPTAMSRNQKGGEYKPVEDDGGAKALWDPLWSFNVEAAQGSAANFSPFMWDGDLYISKWNTAFIGKYVKSGSTWVYSTTIDIGVPPNYVYPEGFATDGTYIYACNGGPTIYQVDPATWTVVNTINVPGQYIDGIAYDAINDGFWISEYQTTATVRRIAKTGGSVLQTLTGSYVIADIAWENTSDGTPYLWMTAAVTGDKNLHRWNLTTNTFQANAKVTTDIPLLSQATTGAGLFTGMDASIGKNVIIGLCENSDIAFCYELGDGGNPPPPPGDYTYHIYMDGDLVGSSTTETYTGVGGGSAVHEWCVTVVCDGGKGAGKTVMTEPTEPQKTLSESEIAQIKELRTRDISGRIPDKIYDIIGKPAMPSGGGAKDYAHEAYLWDEYNSYYYGIELATAAKTPIAPVSISNFPTGEDFDGTDIYRAYEDGSIHKVNDNGSTTLVGYISGLAYFPIGLAYDWVANDGTWYFSDIDLDNNYNYVQTYYKLSIPSLTKTLIGSSAPTSKYIYRGLTVGSNGNLYAVACDYDAVMSYLVNVSKTNGSVTTVGSLGFTVWYGMDMAVDRTTGTMYGAMIDESQYISKYGTLNTSTGAFSQIVNFGYFGAFGGLSITKGGSTPPPPGGESAPVCITFSCEGDCDPPKNVEAVYGTDCDVVHITWDPPTGKGKTMTGPTMAPVSEGFVAQPRSASEKKVSNSAFSTHFANSGEKPLSGGVKSPVANWLTRSNDNADAIGTGGALDMKSGVRYTPADLVTYGIVSGDQITKVRFIPYYASYHTLCEIEIYQGGSWSGSPNPGTLVHTQNVPVNTLINESWTEVTLSSAVNINPAQELWIMIRQVVSYGWPAGCDYGPMHNEKGNIMYAADFGGWMTLDDAGSGDLPYNWNVEAFVTGTPTATDFCTIKISMYSDWDDSWDYGPSGVKVNVNGQYFATFTPNSSYLYYYGDQGSYYQQDVIGLIPSGNLTFTYIPGYYTNDECWFKVFDKDNNVIFDAPYGSLSGLPSPFLTHQHDCGGTPPPPPGDYVYNVYCDDVLIGTTEDTYYDAPVLDPTVSHTWCVTVVCDGGKGAGKTVTTGPTEPVKTLSESEIMTLRELALQNLGASRAPMIPEMEKPTMPLGGAKAFADAYVTEGSSDTYNIVNLANGAMTVVGYGGVAIGDYFATGEDYDGTNMYRLYVDDYNNGSGMVTKIDENGGYTVVGTLSGVSPIGLCYDWIKNDGTWYFTDGAYPNTTQTLYKLSIPSLTMTAIGTFNNITGYPARGLAMAADGMLYMVSLEYNYSGGTSYLLKINPDNAALTQVGPLGFAVLYGLDVAYDKTTNTLYSALIDWTDMYNRFGTFNMTTGAFTSSVVGNMNIQQATLSITKGDNTPPNPGGESMQICVTLDPCIGCNPIPVESLEGTYVYNDEGYCDAVFTWDPPAEGKCGKAPKSNIAPTPEGFVAGEKIDKSERAEVDNGDADPTISKDPNAVSGIGFGEIGKIVGAKGNLAQACNVYQGPVTGHVQFDVDNAYGSMTLKSNFSTELYAGEYLDGLWYANPNSNTMYIIDPATGTYTTKSTTEWVVDMAWNYATQTMYGTKSGVLYTIDLNTGVYTNLGTLSGLTQSALMTLAIDLSGNAYGIEITSGILYSVNLSTRVCTPIGNTGAGVNFVQTMGYDHNTGDLYWCQYATSGNFYKVNTTTGAAQLLASNTGEMLGFFVPYISNQDVAKAPDPFTVTPVGSQLKANLAWTNPSETIAGDPLTSINSIVIKRDGAQIHEITSGITVGGAMQWQDPDVPLGEHCYSIYAVTDEGNGMSANDCGIFGDMCTMTVELWGMWDDSWNASGWGYGIGGVEIFVDGVSYGSYMGTGGVLSGGDYVQTYNPLIPSGTVEVKWIAGGWSSEKYIKIFDTDGEIAYQCLSYGCVDSWPNGYVITTFESDCGGGIKYNVYMDGAYVTTVNTETFTQYADEYDPSVPHEWCFTVLCADDVESEPVCMTLYGCEPCLAPTILDVTYDEDCTCVTVTWEPNAGKCGSKAMTAPTLDVAAMGHGTGRPVSTQEVSTLLDNSGVYTGAPYVMSDLSRGDYIYGVQAYYGMPQEHVKISLANPGQGTTQSPFYMGTLGGEYYDGYYYCSSEDGNFYKVDHNTGAYTVLINHGAYFNDMTYDYSNNIMYGLRTNTTTVTSTIYSVDLNTGAATLVSTLSGMSGSGFITVACNVSGDMYGITLDGSGATLYSINLSASTCTSIGGTGLTSNFAQGSTFDHETGTYYWCNYRGSGASNLCIVNVSTGTATPVNSNAIGEVCGAYIPFVANQDVAKAPSPFNVSAVGTQLKASLAWTNPTETLAGDPLTSIDKIVLLRDGQPLTEFPTVSPGQSMTYTDATVPSAGNHCYSAYAVTSEGNGMSGSDCDIFGMMCNIRFEKYDDYGDGWNGGTLTVAIDGNAVATVGFTTGSYGTETLLIPAGTLTLSWNPGSFDCEVAIQVFDQDDELIYASPANGSYPCNTPGVGMYGLSGLVHTSEFGCAGPALYNVYYDGVLIAEEVSETSITFCDDDLPCDWSWGWHLWEVTMLCEYGESQPGSYLAQGCTGDCQPLSNLQVNYTGVDCNALLTWDAPEPCDGKGKMPKMGPIMFEEYKFTARFGNETGDRSAGGYRDMSTRSVVSASSVTPPADITERSSMTSIPALGRGPNTIAYALDCWEQHLGSQPAVTIPLNNPSDMTVIANSVPPLLVGGDWIDGGWYGVTQDNGNLYKIDPATGAYTVATNHGLTGAVGLCYSPTDDNVYISNYYGEIYTLDITNGATNYVTTINGGGNYIAFIVTNDGRFIAVDIWYNCIVEVDLSNGAVTTLIDAYDFGVDSYYVQDIAIDREDNTIYWAPFNMNPWNAELWKVDIDNYTLTYIGTFKDAGSEIVAFAIPTEAGSTGGYNIYRDGVLIAENWPDTEYLDLSDDFDCESDHTWCVRVACKPEGESAEICVWKRSCCVCDPIDPCAFEPQQPKEGEVLLTWEAPDIPGFLGVKITRDGIIIASMVPDTSYTDYVSVGNHVYCITALYDKPECTEGETVCCVVYVYEQCDPVNNVTATIIAPDQVYVSWIAVNALGVVDYSVFRDGNALTPPTTTETFYIDYEVPVGPHTYSVVVNYNKPTDPCTASEETESNEIVIELCAAVENVAVTEAATDHITLTWEYDIATYPGTTFDVYRDFVLIANTDELTYTDEGTFAEGVLYQYCVAPAYETCQVAPVCVDAYIPPCVPFNVTDLELEGNYDAKAVTLTWNYDGANATYTILRNNKELATGITAKTYTDETIAYDVVYKYCVVPVADCPGGGMACNTIVVDGVTINELDGISIYPNPASTAVTIKGANVIRLDIYNAIGQLVQTIKSAEGEYISLVDVTNYESGAYIFKLYTADKAVITKPIVVAKY